jgi:trehalose-6-phosphate hydrolase
LLLEDDPHIFAYVRNGENEKLLVVSNFFATDAVFRLPDDVDVEGYKSRMLLSNYADAPEHIREIALRPYESIVYHLTK